MNRKTLIILKFAVWIACLWPIALLVRGALTLNGLGPDPTSHIALTTGYTTLMLLTITLAISPVRRIVPAPGLAHPFSPPARPFRILLCHRAHAHLRCPLFRFQPPGHGR